MTQASDAAAIKEASIRKNKCSLLARLISFQTKKAASKQQMMAEKKAFLVINKFVKANENPWIEGVFWKKKHAREYARQLIRKTGTLNYKFLYSIITYRFG